MDDTLIGGTLYHCFCGKLLQGWGGELNRYKDTKEGDEFLERLEQISIKTVRLLISKLISQGTVLEDTRKRASHRCMHAQLSLADKGASWVISL
jgi:hypothetical protein